MHPLLQQVYSFAQQKGLAQPTIIGASKGQAALWVNSFYLQGLAHVGENYLSELQNKHPQLNPRFVRHYIGRVQSKKLPNIVKLCHAVHTLENEKHILLTQQAAERLEKRVDVFIQVNVGAEPQKGGCSIHEVPALVKLAQRQPNLCLQGFMCLPPAHKNPEPYFVHMQQLKHSLNLPCLSMGMSADWQQALLHGATHLRLGSSLFGERT